MGFRENVSRLPRAPGAALHLFAFCNLSTRAPDRDVIVRNAAATANSYRIFYNEAKAAHGVITAASAQRMLETFAEIVVRATDDPGTHQNVDFLLRVVEQGNVRFVCRVDGEYF